MPLDHESCCRAVEARDARFDGVFFVAITSTGIYCRPICPARPTLRKNRRFFSHAAAAERAGFRPCLRCRPELAPGMARIDAIPRLAESVARRISAGALNGAGVERLARELGVSGRQMRRALERELGVTPLELAQTHRLLLAKQLLTETALPMTRVAFASGFQSVRRFNALFQDRYRLSPHALRKAKAPAHARAPQTAGDTVRLTMSYRAPLAWDALLAFLAARATTGVELVADGRYRRTVRIGKHAGVVGVTLGARPRALVVDVSTSLLPVLMPLTARVKQLFDLAAEPDLIEAHLCKAGLATIVRRARGLRVPGAFSGFELAARAVLGQQVTVKAATTFMSRFTSAFGEQVKSDDPALTHLAPTADRVAEASVTRVRAIGIPAARAATLVALAERMASGTLTIEPESDVRELTRQLTDIPGIGTWTAEYVAMRAVHWPDAFPAADIALRKAAGGVSAARLQRTAERWRPWRAYAAMHLWNSLHGAQTNA